MKRLIPFMILVCSGCGTSWPIYENTLTRNQVRQDKGKSIPITLAVKAAPEAEFREAWSGPPDPEWVKSDMQEAVAALVADLRRTGLFQSVVPWTPAARCDVLVESRQSSGAIRCGTPFVCRAFTLYLVSGESSYRHMYKFRFLSADRSERVDFSRVYHGSYYAPSVLFLPVLCWQRRTTESDLLRHDLLPLLAQIERLKTRTEQEPEQRPQPYR